MVAYAEAMKRATNTACSGERCQEIMEPYISKLHPDEVAGFVKEALEVANIWRELADRYRHGTATKHSR
jgi:hypothetical protein